MAAVKRVLLFISNVVAVVTLVALLGVAGWGAWQLLPEASRRAIIDPQGTVSTAQRTARYGPQNPIVGFFQWLQEWLSERRELVAVVLAADGTDAGIAPLPAWTSVDERRVFGATETLWQSRRARLSGVRWSRLVFYWSDIQPGGPRDWRAHHYLHDAYVRRERANDIELVGVLMSTPRWAARRPADGVHAVPVNLDRPLSDPTNYWAAFVRRMAAEYRGRIDTWIIWNEPDIRRDGPNARYFSWAGSAEDYAQLLKVASLAARQGNPKARIVFGSTTYWADAALHQPLFLERVLAILAEDPEARAANYYVDAVALNLYSSPDDLRRVAGIYRDVLDRYGLDVPIWLTETNATPYDDPVKGLRREPNGLRVTMEEQASFVLQAYALGIASGYERIAIHAMTDRDTSDELWGLLRNDGTLRPAFVSYQVAARYLSGATRATFMPREREEWRWPPGGYVPNWQVYLVAVEREAGPVPELPAPAAQPAGRASPLVTVPPSAQERQRVTIVWNGDGVPLRVAIPRLSERAALVDKYGRVVPLEAEGEHWILTLPAATAQSPADPPGYYFVGGDPLLLIESGVPGDAPVRPPELR